MKITQAENGFVITKENGDLFIYKTLREMADDLEGPAANFWPAPVIVSNTNAVYAPDYYACNLGNVRRAALLGRKIDAIKELRNCFVPRLGLKEAKDIVEQMVIM